MTNLTTEEMQRIVDGAPDGAIEYCLYDYGDSTYPLYLNCENQFYEIDEKVWVDMRLVDNYFHSRRRLSDLRTILAQQQEIERLHQKIEAITIERDEFERLIGGGLRLSFDGSNLTTTIQVGATKEDHNGFANINPGENTVKINKDGHYSVSVGK